MRYHREFEFSAAHFNSERAYEIAWNCNLLSADRESPSPEDTWFVLADIHGHNFRIEVDVVAELESHQTTPWVIDDEALATIVMRWAGCNLSTHPDFYKEKTRATTENMANILLERLVSAFPDVTVTEVKVWETRDIYAVAQF
jgi:6-pyruvoyl-tetrahydropterin synthase